MKRVFTLLLTTLFITVSCGEKVPVTDDDNGGENTEQEGGNGEKEDEGGNGEEPEPPAPTKPVFEKVELMEAFTEDFSDMESASMTYVYKEDSEDFRYYPAYPSLTEKNTKILMMRLDPKDQAGSGNGARSVSAEHTFYGSYSARVKLPDTKTAQANIGANAVLCVSDTDKTHGLSQIEMEWKLADPTIIYLRATTGIAPLENRIERVVDLAKGNVIRATYKSLTTNSNGGYSILDQGNLSKDQNAPSIKAINSYNAASTFYTYGFDWYPESIVWWMKNSTKDEKTILWEYKGTELFPDALADDGIPALPSRMMVGFYHDKTNPVEGKSSATQAPKFPFELEVDWVKYEPFNDHITAWFNEYFED